MEFIAKNKKNCGINISEISWAKNKKVPLLFKINKGHPFLFFIKRGLLFGFFKQKGASNLIFPKITHIKLVQQEQFTWLAWFVKKTLNPTSQSHHRLSLNFIK